MHKLYITLDYKKFYTIQLDKPRGYSAFEINQLIVDILPHLTPKYKDVKFFLVIDSSYIIACEGPYTIAYYLFRNRISGIEEIKNYLLSRKLRAQFHKTSINKLPPTLLAKLPLQLRHPRLKQI